MPKISLPIIDERVRVFVKVGPTLGYGLSAQSVAKGKILGSNVDSKTSKSFKDINGNAFEFGLGAGIGVEIGAIEIGLGYSQGLTAINKKPNTGTYNPYYNNDWSLSLAYRFGSFLNR
ncbi:hypothetical protein FACS1894153_4570 [Bacteroidia bacterium]|nr:hypothetical protein FACS1894153_4570 [Bacteroidia bacterium]